MGSIGFWKILRVLTTNTCNYNCIFCHNEGQVKADTFNIQYLTFENFKYIVEPLLRKGLKEIQFSGGEPFLNPETIRMIKWLNSSSDIEIGCATNTQLLNDDIIEELSKTRVELHIQFPSINKQKFEQITKTNLLSPLIENVFKLKKHGVKISLNYVLLKRDVSDFQELLPFLFENEIGVKILPYINGKTLKSNYFTKDIIPLLDKLSYKFENQNNGSLKWWIRSDRFKPITVKYVNSPCFHKEFEMCKNYAEIRLLPDLTLQPCLINSRSIIKLDFRLCKVNQHRVIQIFEQAWDSFIHC